MLAQIAERCAIGERLFHKPAGCFGEEDLLAVAGGQEAGGAIQRLPEVIASPRVRRAGVQGHPDLEAAGNGPRFCLGCVLDRRGSSHGGGRILERGVKGVAHGLEDVTAAGLDDPAEERVVAREGHAHRVGVLLPQTGTPLDVGKEECDGSDLQGTHDQGEEALAAIGSGSPGALLGRSTMIVHLVDGTYELFRHFYGLRRFHKGEDPPFGAVTGVLHTVLQMIEEGAAYIGVATDHVIESFRNRLWSGYKTGDGVDRALLAQFHPLEEAIASMGAAVWPMTELEADDALASAAHIAAEDAAVQKICIWTPDKDLAQCVRGERIVQVDRKSQKIRNAEGVREKFGVEPGLIPDFLALVGDAADGYPGIRGIGPVTAAGLLNQHGIIEDFPPAVLGDRRDLALLFKKLATLRTDTPLFRDVDELRWRGH